MQIEKIKLNKFLVIGRAGMDIYPDPPGVKTEHAGQFFACLGGSSANIAAAITRHNGAADLVTSVSDDAVGRFVINELKKYGVGTQNIGFVSEGQRTSLAVVESRIEDHQSVIYRNGAADFQMSSKDIQALAYSEYGALIATGTALSDEPSCTAVIDAFSLAKEAGLPIILDIDYRPYSWKSAEHASSVYTKAANQCDIIVGNDDEFGVMAGGKNKGLAFAEFLANSTASIVVYKMGEKGSITFTADRSFKTGIYRVEALKPTGAGDAFMGTFVVSLAQGLALETCVQRASAAAAIVVSKVGCAPAMPTSDDLQNFINQHNGLSVA